MLILESDPVVREGLTVWLGASDRVTLVGAAATLDEVIETAREELPDIVIVGLQRPAFVAEQILRRFPTSRVLVFTRQDSVKEVLRSIEVGASAYVLKSSNADELLRAVETVYNGEVYFDRTVSAILARAYVSEGGAKPGSVTGLTRREAQVLKLIANGRTNREIADELDLSVRTVETHREHIMEKLDLHTAAQLTKYAIARGLVDLAETDFD